MDAIGKERGFLSVSLYDVMIGNSIQRWAKGEQNDVRAHVP